MSKVTKWAVERARAAMQKVIDKKVFDFANKHPVKREQPTCSELLQLAVKDPKWQAYCVRKANAGESHLYINDSNIIKQSPAARERFDNWEAGEKPRVKVIALYKEDLSAKMDAIITNAVIGGIDSADLLKQVEQFCK